MTTPSIQHWPPQVKVCLVCFSLLLYFHVELGWIKRMQSFPTFYTQNKNNIMLHIIWCYYTRWGNKLRRNKVRKAVGPDGISSGLLKSCAVVWETEHNFSLSLKLGEYQIYGKHSGWYHWTYGSLCLTLGVWGSCQWLWSGIRAQRLFLISMQICNSQSLFQPHTWWRSKTLRCR